MSKRKHGTKWEMSTPIIRPDSLISSQQFKDLNPFKVSYEVDKHVNINYIMGWEYGRIWFKEYARWEAMHYGTSSSDKEKEVFRRKTVIRSLKKRKTSK